MSLIKKASCYGKTVLVSPNVSSENIADQRLGSQPLQTGITPPLNMRPPQTQIFPWIFGTLVYSDLLGILENISENFQSGYLSKTYLNPTEILHELKYCGYKLSFRWNLIWQAVSVSTLKCPHLNTSGQVWRKPCYQIWSRTTDFPSEVCLWSSSSSHLPRCLRRTVFDCRKKGRTWQTLSSHPSLRYLLIVSSLVVKFHCFILSHFTFPQGVIFTLPNTYLIHNIPSSTSLLQMFWYNQFICCQYIL